MLKGKIVLISGASSGIGALTAGLIERRGGIPVLTGRNEARLARTAGTIGGQSSYFVMDVTDMKQVEDVVEKVIRQYGRIDILLNNAGYGQFERFEDMSVESFESMMDTNYMGVVRCTKAVLPHMRKQGGGHIVNIASMAGKIGSAKSTSYTATKHALLGFTNSLRMELRSEGIVVSAVNPGPIDTEFFAIADPSGSYTKNIGWFMMKPAYVAKAIVRVMERRKAELDLPHAASVGIKLYGLMPRVADRLFGGLLNRK
ncbi:NAD(P)-dependent oxidoreductase [Paenibacillus agaridevorans]|uniref:NAD(P)-dependent oxidoreductase n=1 Tax=Paenibacillus agaridevorans TaxID=171404 RepID=A0A2R5EQB4_9BACL|nr:SDR family NAD(P)-dependent oxidoreductase [Paenibacillus agaridevorans]GBG08880.1 NAD(P)-dependent oxidoreductase [Paenibacillus agaridevorans]